MLLEARRRVFELAPRLFLGSLDGVVLFVVGDVSFPPGLPFALSGDRGHNGGFADCYFFLFTFLHDERHYLAERTTGAEIGGRSAP